MKPIKPISNAILQSTARAQAPTFTCRAVCTTTRHTNHERQQRRSFVTNPFTQNQTITAQRTLRYPASVIYDIVSDVASYSQFVPYCQGSVVTKYSSPASDGKQYPEEAKLIVGFNDNISEEFTSRVYCVPGRIVEAISGNMASTLEGEEIAHHSARPPADQDPSRKDTVMAQLLTRWTLKPYMYKPPPTSAVHPDSAHKNTQESGVSPSQEQTEVNLAIEFQFANPLYAALSSAAAPKVADKMIEAFEKRVKAVIEGPASVKGKRMEGVLKSMS